MTTGDMQLPIAFIAGAGALIGFIYMVALAIRRRKHTTIIWFNAGGMLFNCFTEFFVVMGWNHSLGNGVYEIATFWLICGAALAAFALFYREFGPK